MPSPEPGGRPHSSQGLCLWTGRNSVHPSDAGTHVTGQKPLSGQNCSGNQAVADANMGQPPGGHPRASPWRPAGCKGAGSVTHGEDMTPAEADAAQQQGQSWRRNRPMPPPASRAADLSPDAQLREGARRLGWHGPGYTCGRRDAAHRRTGTKTG